MKPRYVLDTNVLIAASAADPVHPADIDATPQDPVLRRRVWHWLDTFQASTCRLVLDAAGEIHDEYRHKLGFNDFGIQVVMSKWDQAAVDVVDLEPSPEGYRSLPVEVVRAMHDVADHKMAAAAYVAENTLGTCPVAFAGDTDWHGWEDVLLRHGITLEPLIEHWSRAKFEAKLRR